MKDSTIDAIASVIVMFVYGALSLGFLALGTFVVLTVASCMGVTP